MTDAAEQSDRSQEVVAVYLDQCVLTELRRRKWTEPINLYSMVSYILEHSNAVLCASHTTIDEILQISKQAYIEEHIEVLRTIGFFYLHPDQTRYQKIEDVDRFFEEYVATRRSNRESPMDTALRCWDMVMRKQHGLDIEASYPQLIGEIFTAVRETLVEVMSPEQQALLRPLLDLDRASVESVVQDWLDDHPEFDGGPSHLEQLGQQFINPEKLKELPSDVVVKTLFEDIGFSEDMITHLIDTNPNADPCNLKLSLAFFLMNIVGYRADDFRAVNSKRDGFRASQHDHHHLCNARYAQFLVTEDTKFRVKAEAIYAWAGVSTHVVSIEEFLNSCLPFSVESIRRVYDSKYGKMS